ncbi:hypothetical protein KAR91_06210 [Candidatus Pacearchaeota archaeon]|nr:hypothetical protein [Candidatus Pacearchaeota archaeon]
MEPWEHEQFNSYYENMIMSRGRWRGSSHRTRYETVEDSERLATRKGDIIKFGSGYHERSFGDWRDWFLNREQKKLFWQRTRNIPNYAIHQFAIVANRYKWIKYKTMTWHDYGVILMFVTGNKPCRIRKYYAGQRPYEYVSYFPHIQNDGIYVKMKKPFKVIDKTWFLFDFNLSEFIIDLLTKYGDKEKSRDMFLEKIKQLLEKNI